MLYGSLFTIRLKLSEYSNTFMAPRLYTALSHSDKNTPNPSSALGLSGFMVGHNKLFFYKNIGPQFRILDVFLLAP